MSRIHEALKKAAKERNAQLGGRSGPDLVDFTVDAPALSAERLPLEETPLLRRDNWTAPAPTEPLPFDQLVKGCARGKWKLDAKKSVFAAERDDLVVAEKFRTLRSRLYQVAAVQRLHSIVVTSSVPAEGKTFVAANLALSFVRQQDRRVLLIDADLRASRLHLQLGAMEKPGLTDYLRGKASESEIIQLGPEGNLCFIPGGSDVTNPSELLHSDRMKQLVERMSHIFDWVILDSPPAVAVHDASILADMCDGVLFVVRAGSTDFEIAEKAASEFREKKLLGVVLNRVDRSQAYGTYYYGYTDEKKPAEQEQN
jgi:protein-tyrosine kinase